LVDRGAHQRPPDDKDKDAMPGARHAIQPTLLAALLLSTALAGAGVVGVPQVLAQSAAQSFVLDIPAQPLASAIAALGAATGWRIAYGFAPPQGVESQAVSGAYTAPDALAQMLGGTGLSWRVAGADALLIEDPAATPVAYDGSIMLDQIDVVAWVESASSGSGFMGTPDWVYETPASVSVVGREAIVAAGVRDVRDLLSNVSGAYVNTANATYPSISPNLRGLQDMGRIVVSIDGARQNASQGIAAGAEVYQGGSSHAYVDSAFIRTVEVNKSTGPGAGSGGSLGGTVTFRTIEAADLIEDGRNWGVEINATTGTNNHHFQGSILAAARLTDTPFSVVAGLSGLNLGEYRMGQNGSVTWDGIAGNETHLMGRENWSSLLKLEGDFGDLQTALAWTHQQKNFSYAVGGAAAMQSMVATTDTLTGIVGYDPVDNDLVDLDARLWLNVTTTNQLRHQRTSNINGTIVVNAPDTHIDNTLTSFGVSLDNTSRFDTAIGPLSLNYGVEAFRDDGQTTASSTTIAQNPSWASNYTSFYPAGIRDFASAYANLTLEPTEWVKLTGGVRYDWYRLQGSPTYYYQTTQTVGTPSRQAGAVTTYEAWAQAYNPTLYNFWNDRCLGITVSSPALMAAACDRLALTGEIVNGSWYATGAWILGNQTTQVVYPETVLDIDRSGGALLPSATIEFTPVEWFRPYIGYSESLRPPTITEAFLAGGPPGDGAPGMSYAPYDGLQPERARTWEVGANVSLDDVLLENDALRLKLAAFSREVDNYIVVGQHYRAGSSQLFQGYMNLLDPTRMRGIEIEGNYDARSFWIGGSATYLETEWGRSLAITSNGADSTTGEVFMWAGDVPPRFKLTLDGGVRLMDERLALGGTVTHVTPTLTQTQTFSQDGKFLTEEYTTLDLYGSFQLSENATLRANVSNVLDVNYVAAGSRYPAPGRTVTVSLNARF
jgi:hemoglobin/transferrin/lactoferrin receptor protein